MYAGFERIEILAIAQARVTVTDWVRVEGD